VHEVTRILSAVQQGDVDAAHKLFPLVYEELHRIAAAKMAYEAPGQTLQPTALVHEAWLRLGGDAQPPWQNRAHFFSAAAEAMRRILIDIARRKLQVKRGGGLERVEFHNLPIVLPVDDEKLLEVNDVLDLLEREDPRKAEIVKHRCFTGLNNQQIAALLDLNERTVRRQWELAKVRLVQLLKTR